MLGIGGGTGALIMTSMGFRQQDRMYGKTLKYMHNSRVAAAKRMAGPSEMDEKVVRR